MIYKTDFISIKISSCRFIMDAVAKKEFFVAI